MGECHDQGQALLSYSQSLVSWEPLLNMLSRTEGRAEVVEIRLWTLYYISEAIWCLQLFDRASRVGTFLFWVGQIFGLLNVEQKLSSSLAAVTPASSSDCCLHLSWAFFWNVGSENGAVPALSLPCKLPCGPIWDRAVSVPNIYLGTKCMCIIF